MRILPTQPLFDPSIQIPFIQKKNNNKNNKIKNNVQNEKNEEDEEESEINNNMNENNNIFNKYSKKNVAEIKPQLINSFYFLNENLKKENSQANEILTNNNEQNRKKSSSIAHNIKNKNKDKSKYKKNNLLFNKNLLTILENFDLTNEEKLLYILDNYKNIKIDPLIIKVLEYRKKLRKNGEFENKNINILNGNLNNNNISDNEKLKLALNKKSELINNSNNIQSPFNENNSYIPPQPVKINFPIEDKVLFQNLEKYKISADILDRPTSTKIDLDYNILNKLFIVWDFLITFKDTVFTEKVYDFEVDKNIITFYSNLIDATNNYSYYKSIFISLLLVCIKNIPLAIQSARTPRIFLLKSILDNLHSISYNIIYDSPLVVLKEITECYLYYNSIEENNNKIIHNVLENANNINNKESFENNKKIYEKEEIKEDSIVNIDNNTKICLLHIIIGLCFETIIIKDKIKVEYDNMNSLSYNKKGLDESLFDTEKRMKELNRMENFKTLPKEIENLENKLNELKGINYNKMEIENEEKEKNEKNVENLEKSAKNAEIGENININEDKIIEEEKNEKEKNINDLNNKDNTGVVNDTVKKKEIQEIEMQIERYKSMITENEKLIERKKDINNKISEIIEKIKNLKTLRKKYLGIDYQSNEYYYFISVPDKIYTKNKKKKEWGYFENKEDIQKLINKLTDKGKNEKKLKIILKFILAQMEKEEKEKEKENLLKKEEKEKEEKAKENILIEEEKISEEKKDSNNNINTINENKKEQDNEENKKDEDEDEDVLINIEKSQKNENENDKSNICTINLGPTPKKRGRNKIKEEEKINNIHILEDDEEEEIEEDKEEINIKETEKENNIEIEEKENISLNKNKDKDKNKDTKPVLPTIKKELFTFVISEDRLQLNFILMKIDEVFSEYLVQFNKQWESEKNRNIWKIIISNNATDKNILTSLKMFNHKFKNPYKILSKEEEQELLLKEKINKGNNFVFDEENGNQFSIPETNNLLLLSPKVKIWSKEMDLIDIDNYYNNDLLVNVYSREQLCYVVHFYEMAIFGLVHRREGKRKL